MNRKDLEPGGLYLGTAGQIREIIQIDGQHLTYCQVKDSTTSRVTRSPAVGYIRTVEVREFAYWAVREVPDLAFLGRKPIAFGRKGA